MIRVAIESDFNREITSESELRICALKLAYGLDVPFIQFFADDEGAIASVMDGFCTVYVGEKMNDEWRVFLQMHADIRAIHSSEDVIATLSREMNIPYKKGEVMRISDMSSKVTLHEYQPRNIALREVYTLLNAVFGDLPPFDGWYVDASHRVRHGCCHITAESENGRLIGCAMTVAETEIAALIGGVATLSEHRGRGVATCCVTELLAQLPQKTVLIAPRDEKAAGLYQKLGFVPCGTWAELTLP